MGNNTKRSPNFNINRASWLPGLLKRQKFKWMSLPVIRRPESSWKMSYGYFWRTKCSVSPQGKPWIARVGITWKEGLADVLGTCHRRSVFCSQRHRSPSKETVQKDSCICESVCEKLTGACYRMGGGGAKRILQHLIWIYCFIFGETWLATLLPKRPRLWGVAVANLCRCFGCIQSVKDGEPCTCGRPLLHLTEMTSFWCHPLCAHVSRWSSHCLPPEETRTRAHTGGICQSCTEIKSRQFNASFKGGCGFIC